MRARRRLILLSMTLPFGVRQSVCRLIAFSPRGSPPKGDRFHSTTCHFDANDRTNGDSFLMPDSAVYYQPLSGYLQRRELTLSDPFQ